MAEFIGIIPAAGRGSRLQPYRYSKELIPVQLNYNQHLNIIAPKAIIEHSIGLMAEAGMSRIFVCVSQTKFEILRYLGDGSDFGVSLGYLLQQNPTGMCKAIDLAHDWLFDNHTCLAMPDTLIRPTDAMSKISRHLVEKNADLVLGIFPTEYPTLLGPVRTVVEQGITRVLEVLDKPTETDLKNTWGIACWNVSFAKLLHEHLLSASSDREIALGTIFQIAVNSGLNVNAIDFSLTGGAFYDIGTPSGLHNVWKQVDP